jgi:hypothetical protein
MDRDVGLGGSMKNGLIRSHDANIRAHICDFKEMCKGKSATSPNLLSNGQRWELQGFAKSRLAVTIDETGLSRGLRS